MSVRPLRQPSTVDLMSAIALDQVSSTQAVRGRVNAHTVLRDLFPAWSSNCMVRNGDFPTNGTI